MQINDVLRCVNIYLMMVYESWRRHQHVEEKVRIRVVSSAPEEQVLSVSQALLVVLHIDDVMQFAATGNNVYVCVCVCVCVCVPAGWMWRGVLAGTAPGGEQRRMMQVEVQEEEVEEEQAWRLRWYRWSCTILQEPK